jgi:hypothetical protein
MAAMERRVRVFHSFEDAERAEDEYYAALTPQQRVDLLIELIAAWTETLGGASEGLARVHRVVELSQS